MRIECLFAVTNVLLAMVVLTEYDIKTQELNDVIQLTIHFTNSSLAEIELQDIFKMIIHTLRLN